MDNKFVPDLGWADVTPKQLFFSRRAALGALMAAGTGAVLPSMGVADDGFIATETPNSFEEITQYNNFYEFGLDKEDPARLAGGLTIAPWQVQVDGMVDRPGVYELADLLDGLPVHNRIYRFRCVEAWSMVVPWNGIELRALLQKLGVQPGARYVGFETLVRPEEMPGQRRAALDWPYREGLRLDEAMHPLTLLATGLYDAPLPRQNGAPLRLVVPWKYGFKSIKSVVRLTITDAQPKTTWNMENSREYGFYANVNPQVDHPRWSQASERRIGGGLFARRQPTLPFNGYQAQVASLYEGMDLTKEF